MSTDPSGARGRNDRRRLVDKAVRGLVTSSGVVLLLLLGAIFFVIAFEALPLFRSPSAAPAPAQGLKLSAPPLHVQVDPYQEVAFVVTAEGGRFFSLKDGSPVADAPTLDPAPAQVTCVSSVSSGDKSSLVLGLSDGRILPTTVKYRVIFLDGKRTAKPTLEPGAALPADPDGRPARFVAQAALDEGLLTAALFSPRDLKIVVAKRKRSLIGEGKPVVSVLKVDLPLDSDITAAALDSRAEDLFLGTASGQLVRIYLRDPSQPKVAPPLKAVEKDGTAVTAMGFLLGDRTLAVGDASGGVSTWLVLHPDKSEPYLVKVNTFEPHGAPLVSFSPSQRDKGFLALDAKGGVKLNYGTTGRTLLELQAAGLGEAKAITYAPKGDAILAAGRDGTLARWDLRNPHPEITLKALFLPVWYEGYERPELEWHSTGGTDEFESKFSLTPLIFGTLKGTFYALFFAVPLALLSALYVSQFMHPSIKATMKSAMELMAAVPTVVLGFIAGLWLAPKLEQMLPGVALMPAMIAGLSLAACMGWRRLPPGLRRKFKPGSEALLLLPIVVLGAALSLALGGVFEQGLKGGSYPVWIEQTLGLTFEQRNSVVVGFAMGFAVIPIMFTIAEDALSSVPPHLAAGSLALGATPWQTAVHLILPAASPGILSAVMLGFGRAAGETMIVLMATGNTPIMTFSPYTGFRALSANIAVEFPCCPEGGTLFRMLFLAALLLFLLTFIVNTVAEVLRLRLRRKYQSL